MRENWLCQTDWLMRFCELRAEKVAGKQTPRLEFDIDPKLAWTLQNPVFFPSMSTVRTMGFAFGGGLFHRLFCRLV